MDTHAPITTPFTGTWSHCTRDICPLFPADEAETPFKAPVEFWIWRCSGLLTRTVQHHPHFHRPCSAFGFTAELWATKTVQNLSISGGGGKFKINISKQKLELIQLTLGQLWHIRVTSPEVVPAQGCPAELFQLVKGLLNSLLDNTNSDQMVPHYDTSASHFENWLHLSEL